MREKSPCIDCQKRAVNCHALCTDFSNYKAKIAVVNSTIKKAKEAMRIADGGKNARVRY